MDNEITKKFVENTGFICIKCGSVIVDGHKHDNEEDLCDKCRILDLEAKLAEKDTEIDDLKRDYIPKLEFGLQRANKMGKKLDVENEELKQQLAEMTEKYNACQEARKLEIEFSQQDKDQLKQQLAEWQDGTIICKWTDAENKVKELEQQLAEKEEEIEKWKQNVKDTLNAYSDEFVEKDKELKELRYKVKKHNQDKIELLEKVNARIKGLTFKPDKCLNKKGCIEDCVEVIETLISEIKGE